MPSTIKYSFPSYHVVNFQASYNTALGMKIPMEIRQRARYHQPNPLDDKSGIIVMHVTVNSKGSDQFHMSIMTETGVIFSRKPDDINAYIAEKCLPIVRMQVVNSIQRLTNDMGFSPLDISEQMGIKKQ
jgi:hypothetical protein